MPLARIITRVQEDADELANDLRSRGFEIEIVSPDNVPPHPVDLEVSLEECATEDALASAENTPQPQDVCVFIAPGALVETARPTVVVPLFSEPIVGPSIAEPPPLAEAVTLMADSEPIGELVGSHQTDHLATPGTIEPPIAEHVEPELQDAPSAIVLEGETVGDPLLETLPPVAAIPGGERFQHRLRIRIKHSDKVFWRAALATAILAVGGLLTLSAHRYSPLPSGPESTTSPVPQAGPFASAKTQKASLPTDQSAASPAPARAPEPKASAASHVIEVRRRAQSRQRTVAFNPKHSRPNPESDFVAADTVVRYRKPAAVPTPQVSKKTGIKLYTDLK